MFRHSTNTASFFPCLIAAFIFSLSAAGSAWAAQAAGNTNFGKDALKKNARGSYTRAADLVVVGTVVTMAAGKPNARGLAVTGGKIAFVGDAASARKRLRPGGRLIVLEPGQAVIPGLVDAHVHMLDAGLMLTRCPLDEAPRGPEGKDRALEMIAGCSERACKEDKEWVIGSGWSLLWFDDKHRGPSAAELDAVVADLPAVFYDDNGHSAWVNSLALQRAHIDFCGAIPQGRIECADDQKTPWGTLREAAQDLLDLQRGDVEPLALGLGNPPDPMHHRRHRVHPVDAVLLYQRKGRHCIEPRHHDQVISAQKREQRHGERSVVIGAAPSPGAPRPPEPAATLRSPRSPPTHRPALRR